jgi:hypothetical protein
VLLNPSEELPVGDVLVLLGVERDGVDQFEVVPVDVAIFYLLGLLLFLTPRLLLSGEVVVVDGPAGVKDLLSALKVGRESLQLLVLNFENICIGLHHLREVNVALRGSPQEFELGIIFFPLTQRH